MIKKYNKLVRDKIPEVIQAKGDICKIEILTDEEYVKLLDKKLNEEVTEYQADKNIEELADILEVVYAIAKAKGYRISELEKTRLKKAKSRGGFENKILLVEVDEK